ncbi:MAG: hypothetical protein KJ634_03775 [Gammaproteobacteria bacterium]|nr:hypothetical protein [Gammaproteobacteria bacterium]MBU1414723.1 hypothetical protein [Gammaproteobacteria bacterium]
MNGRKLMTAVALAVLSIGSAVAQDTAPVYGSQLMTQQERMEYRNQMRTLKTQEERNAFRLEHHKRMQERAKERGVTLPDAPPAAGNGMGPGGGRGMGDGPGMGGGMGRGRQ